MDVIIVQRVILLENDLSAEKGKTREMLDQVAILESKLKKASRPHTASNLPLHQ